MATLIFKKTIASATAVPLRRSKTTSAQYVASRARDTTFEKLMDKYKNLLKVISIQDLILASTSDPPAVSLDFLRRLSHRLHLNRGPAAFLRNYPHVFRVFSHPAKLQPFCSLTPSALEIARLESRAIDNSLPLAVTRLVKLLSMSPTRKLPLRAIFKIWRELGLPDDFENSVISRNSQIFSLVEGNEPNTHILVLNDDHEFNDCLVPAVDNWRVVECCKDGTDLKYSFKHGFPPVMWLKKDFKAKVRQWQRLPYVGPYEPEEFKNRARMEKRAVGIVHEFLSLTVERMVEVEKISHFRKWFGVKFNVRDLFLDHPGMFYLSTKGHTHTVLLREAYDRGRLVVRDPVYEARMKLLEFVLLGRRGLEGYGDESAGVQ